MTPFPWIDGLVIVGLVLCNALFAMSEMAIVAARTGKLRVAADQGNHRAALALVLATDPGRFLSTVQTGVTLVGMIAGAFSGVTLGVPVGERLRVLGVPAAFAPEAGFIAAVIATTYANLVFGELVPKQIALRSAERIAIIVARPLMVMARITAPLVWVLDRSSALVLRLVGGRDAQRHEVTAEELHLIIAEASRTGAIEEDERALMTSILRLADRPVRELMTPRTDIDSIRQNSDHEQIRAAIANSPHSLLPVTAGSSDQVVGVVKVRELLGALVAGHQLDVATVVRKAEIIPDQLDAIDALRILQHSDVAMGLVHDEYGHLEGIVTPADLLSALVGDFASDRDEGEEPLITTNPDGVLIVGGALSADTLADRLGITLSDGRDYATAAGFALSIFKRLPVAGDHFSALGWRFEVLAMYGRKIGKLRITRLDDDKSIESKTTA